jgi:hypothetical protein
MKTSVILFVAGLVVVKSAGTTNNGLNFVTPRYEKETGIISLNCIERHYEITTGQTYDGISCSDNVLSVRADHKNSVEVATAFFEGVPADVAYTSSCLDSRGPDCPARPKELNFYVEVDVTFTLDSQNMGTHTLRIGQGHAGGDGSWFGYNNWWIEGGTLCQPYEGESGPDSGKLACAIACQNKEGQIIIFQPGDEYYEVFVSFLPPTPAPTPAPTTRTPTTRAPTRNYNPECLSSLPGVDGEDLEASHNLCVEHYNWLTQNWNTTGPFPGEPNVYEKAGVDGSPCSIVNYLSNRTKEEKDDTWCLCQCPH